MSDQRKIAETKPRLLVPMNIEAMVIGKKTGGTEWVNRVPSFEGIYYNQFLGQQLESKACSDTVSDLYESGVYLHWALPDGLTHGITGDNGSEPEFPLIPNRWLIVRFWDQGGENQELDLKFKAWIMENDTITDDTDATAWPSLGPLKPDPKNEADYYVYVGKQYELNVWPGETAAPCVDITAVGYGETVFSAYYPACRGILGFRDTDPPILPEQDRGSLMYFVAGWYSDPSKDPLAKGMTEKTLQRLEEILGERKWTFPGFAEALDKVKEADDLADRLKEAKEMLARVIDVHDQLEENPPAPAHAQAIQGDLKKGEAGLQEKIGKLENDYQALSADLEGLQKDLPAQILCHGIIAGIRWQGKDKSYASGVPRPEEPFSVAVGNTAVEALSALFKEKLDSDLVRLLEVFQYDLLADFEKPGGRAKVDQKIHERAFKPLAHGIYWNPRQENQIPTTNSNENKTPDVSNQDQTPPIPGEIRLLLENLNKRQREINRLKREQDSAKSELYAIWYKKVLDAEDGAVREGVLNQRLTELQQQIDTLAAQIVQLEDAGEERPRGVEWDQLKAKLADFCPDWQLQKLDEPRFWRPNDPVVLLAGKPFQRSSRHGEDGRFRNDGQLLCRLSGQEISGLKITIPHAKIKDVEFGPQDLDAWCPAFFEQAKPSIPAEIANLFRECLLLTIDSKRAHEISTAAYEKNEPGLAADRAADVKNLAADLIKKYFKKVWEIVRDPENLDPDLRYDDGQTVWEFDGKFPSPVVLNTWEKNPWLPLFLQWQVSWIPSSDDTARVLENWELTEQGTGFKWGGPDPGRLDRKTVYSGTTVLTPSAAFNFSDRLRRYNLTHGNQKLKDLQTRVSQMNMLCQSLGGFTENLLMRKAYLELNPLDPGKGDNGPHFSAISGVVQDIDWLSPLVDKPFFPIRAGHLRLEKLWIIDAFGQVFKLEGEPQGDKVTHPLLPAGLAGPDGFLRLEPRLNQPARLTVDWPAAGRWEPAGDSNSPLGEDEEFNPVCGWILPNFLDRSLMVYDDRGNALGALQIVQRKSWVEGVGAEMGEIESFHWIDIPGSESFFFGKPDAEIIDPLGKQANPHLQAFVKALLSLSEGRGQAFAQLIKNMNDTLSAGGSSGTGQNPNLALLIGKPLALVRASLCLELDGHAALSQGWGDLQAEQTGGIEKVKFPIRLGDRQKLHDFWLSEDGLVGFFLNRNYNQFFPAFGLEGNDDDYSRYNVVPEIAVDEPLDLTLLLDPSRGICATSGILPRKNYNMPYGDITETLENKQIVFFTGPVVSTESTEDKIRMPQPSDVYGQWSWTHHPEVKVWREASIADSQKEQGRFFDESLQITEGWLKLITAPLEIRVFKVKGIEPVEGNEKSEKKGPADKPDRFKISSGSVILSWSVIGAEAIELKRGKSSLFESGRHPLPTQYQVRVDQNTSFTLAATGRVQKSTESKEQKMETKVKTIEIVIVSPK